MTDARLARISGRVLVLPAPVSGRLAKIDLRALIRSCNKVWVYTGDGTEPFDSDNRVPAPIMLWNGSTMILARAIRLWDGDAFVDPICPNVEILPRCTELFRDPFNNLSKWTESIGNPTIVTGRTGTGVEMSAGASDPTSFDSIFYSIPDVNQSSTLTMGFAWKVQSVLTTRVIAQFQSEGIVHVELSTNSDGSLDIRRGTPAGNIIATTAPGIWTTNTWYYLEWQAYLRNVGSVKLRVNGTELINTVSVDTRNGGAKMKFDRVAIGTTHSQVQTIDDLYLLSGTECDFVGSITI